MLMIFFTFVLHLKEKILKKLAVVFLLFFSLLSFAQESIDLLTVAGHYALPSAYEDGVEGEAKERRLMVNLKLPIVLDSNNIWFSNLTYVNSVVRSTRVFGDSIADPIHLQGVILQTGWIHKFSKQRSLQLLVVPRLMGDMQNLNRKNFQLGLVALYEKRFNEKLKMKFGALYNQEISGPFVVPLIDLDWKLSKKWSVSGLVPIYSKIKYTFSENTVAGVGHFALLTSYRLGAEAYRDDYIDKSSIDVFAFLRQRVSGNVHIEGRVGYALDRTYEQFGKDDTIDFRFSLFTWGDNRVAKNYAFNDGVFVNLRLVYNLPID